MLLCYYGSHRHRSTPRSRLSGRFKPSDATIVCPTIDTGPAFNTALLSWLASDPYEVVVVITPAWSTHVRACIGSVIDPRVTICAIDEVGKKSGLIKGINRATTSAIVLVDDAITWKPKTVEALFDNLASSPTVGGVTAIKNKISNPRKAVPATAWQAMGAARLDRRIIVNACMAHFCHGQVTVCTGRTSAYRAEILQGPSFEKYLGEDYWRVKYLLRSGDDTSITKWPYRRGWHSRSVSDDAAAIASPSRTDRAYLKQLMR